MRRHPVALAAALALLGSTLAIAPVAVAAVSDLDPTFGTGGKVIGDMGPDTNVASSVAIQADGKIVVAGVGGSRHFALARYLTDGSLDATFDGDGKVFTSLGGAGTAQAVAIQTDGKIVAAGSISDNVSCCPVAVVRYQPDGSLDTSFDGDGIATTTIGMSMPRALAIQADGMIVVAGAGSNGSVSGFTLARFDPTGAIDASFGIGGGVTTSFGGPETTATGVAIQADGKLVAAGFGGPGIDFALARYSSAGSLDATFGSGGTVTTDFGGSDFVRGIALQSNGRIVVAGMGNLQFALARYLSDGTLDPSYDGDGKVTTRFFGEYEEANALAIQSNGKVVAVGRVFSLYDPSFALARYNTDGSLDGKETTDFGDPADIGVVCPVGRKDCSEDDAFGVAIQANGRIVVVGGSGPCGGPCEWTVARYTDVAPIRELSAAPTTVDLGTASTASRSASAIVTITNTGSIDLTISQVELAGGQAASFSIVSQGCPLGTIARGDSCQIEVAFAPDAPGAAVTELRIASDATASPLVVPLSGVGVPPPSGIVWGASHNVGPRYAWDSGNGLARTATGGQRFHVAYATDRIGSRWARNAGPHLGIYYVRSSTGTTWSSPKRLNPASQHSERVGVAASGSRVYVTWVSQTRITGFKPKSPRVLYVRVNTNRGAATSWRSVVRLTATAGRVDYPTIGASGNDVYIAYTDSVTGAVRLAISRDRGVHWSKSTVGRTTAASTQGYGAYPSVAGHGANVVVAWAADATGTIAARLSSDRGKTWSTTESWAAQDKSAISVSALGTRAAVSWSTGPEVHVRIAEAGAWGPDRLVAGISADAEWAYAPAAALQGTSRVALAWAEELQGDNGWSRLNWTESADDGERWFQTQVLAGPTAGTHRSNDWASIVWASESTRQVLWNSWTPNSVFYRLLIRTGTGSPVGPAIAAEPASGLGAEPGVPSTYGNPRIRSEQRRTARP